MFSTHVAILAHGERIAQVQHSFDAIKPRLRVGVSSPFHAAHDRQPCPFREDFGEGFGLVETAFSHSSGVKRHGNQAIRWIRLYSSVLHGFDQISREHTAEIKLATVLKAMDQLS